MKFNETFPKESPKWVLYIRWAKWEWSLIQGCHVEVTDDKTLEMCLGFEKTSLPRCTCDRHRWSAPSSWTSLCLPGQTQQWNWRSQSSQPDTRWRCGRFLQRCVGLGSAGTAWHWASSSQENDSERLWVTPAGGGSHLTKEYPLSSWSLEYKVRGVQWRHFTAYALLFSATVYFLYVLYNFVYLLYILLHSAIEDNLSQKVL